MTCDDKVFICCSLFYIIYVMYTVRRMNKRKKARKNKVLFFPRKLVIAYMIKMLLNVKSHDNTQMKK